MSGNRQSGCHERRRSASECQVGSDWNRSVIERYGSRRCATTCRLRCDSDSQCNRLLEHGRVCTGHYSRGGAPFQYLQCECLRTSIRFCVGHARVHRVGVSRARSAGEGSRTHRDLRDSGRENRDVPGERFGSAVFREGVSVRDAHGATGERYSRDMRVVLIVDVDVQRQGRCGFFWPLSVSSSKVYEPAQNASVFHWNVNVFPTWPNVPAPLCTAPFTISAVRPVVTVLHPSAETGPTAYSEFAAVFVTYELT